LSSISIPFPRKNFFRTFSMVPSVTWNSIYQISGFRRKEFHGSPLVGQTNGEARNFLYLPIFTSVQPGIFCFSHFCLGIVHPQLNSATQNSALHSLVLAYLSLNSVSHQKL
jgi:hypothetical protein